MPHLNIEYSANLEEALDMQALVDRIHETALETGIFPLGGVRTRAEPRKHYRIANGDPRAGYIHMMVRIGSGRDADTRRKAGEHIFAALCDFTDELYHSRPLALSFELHEIPPDMAWRKNNLHELLKKEASE
ncbi:MAG: 5-carboxymethyl-2-hydroxymuconate Delta-isomerase [Sphingomicrobium sp.]